MNAEARQILTLALRRVSGTMTVVDQDLDGGIVQVRWAGSLNIMYFPEGSVEADIQQATESDKEYPYYSGNGPTLAEGIANSIADVLSESMETTPNPGRVWTFVGGDILPVPPDDVEEYLRFIPPLRVSLTRYAIVDTSTDRHREVSPEQMDLDQSLTDELYRWWNDIADHLNGVGTSDAANWRKLDSRGRGLSERIQRAVGPDLPVAYNGINASIVARTLPTGLISGAWIE